MGLLILFIKYILVLNNKSIYNGDFFVLCFIVGVNVFIIKYNENSEGDMKVGLIMFNGIILVGVILNLLFF